MLVLEKFEQLARIPIALKTVAMQIIGTEGERLSLWTATLPRLDKHEQYRQIKVVLSELIVADMPDLKRLSLLDTVMASAEKLVGQLQSEYVNNPQSPMTEQKTCVEEVRSLYFLLILAYQGIAFRNHEYLEKTNEANKANNKKGGWLKKLTGSVIRSGSGFDIMDEHKRLYVVAVNHLTILCYKLQMEYALTYKKCPSVIWRILNNWYLKSAIVGVDKLCMSKLGEYPVGNIYNKYLQCCLASFANLFAYRRADIINIFKIIPSWIAYVKTTFTPDAQLRIFVNLQAATPPELITPYASINPYSNERVCLFFDVKDLFVHLKTLEDNGVGVDQKNSFENRLASMVLMAFGRQATNGEMNKAYNQQADVLVGFGRIYKEIAEGKSFNQVIAQSKLPEEYRPKRVFDLNVGNEKEQVGIIRKSDAGTQFVIAGFAQTEEGEDDMVLSRPYLPVFGLFALKTQKSKDDNPWHLGVVHWVDQKQNSVEVEGRFLGKLLSVCGIRLNSRDMRSKDFVQALLVAGDGLNQQTTLVLPRYHFKEGDTVILRVSEKESILRLEQNLLSTDDIEQYQIVRLTT